MFTDAREEIKLWLERPLNDFYTIIYIDAVFIPTRRIDNINKEAYYTVLDVLVKYLGPLIFRPREVVNGFLLSSS